jgi:post-segregation antitoxin (ccd killing protein)
MRTKIDEKLLHRSPAPNEATSSITIRLPKAHMDVLRENRVNMSQVCRSAIEKAYKACA